MVKDYFILFFISSFAFSCSNNEGVYLFKLKKCNNVHTPSGIIYQNRAVGTLTEIMTFENEQCIAKGTFISEFTLKKNMTIFFKQAFVGDSYLEIVIDSLKPQNNARTSYKDTLIVY